MTEFQLKWARDNRTKKTKLSPLLRFGVPILVWVTAVLIVLLEYSPDSFAPPLHNLVRGLLLIYIATIVVLTGLFTVLVPLCLLGTYAFTTELKQGKTGAAEYDKSKGQLADRMLPAPSSMFRTLMTCVLAALFLAGGAYWCGLLLISGHLWTVFLFYVDRETIREWAREAITPENIGRVEALRTRP